MKNIIKSTLIAVLAAFTGCSQKHPLIGYWVEDWTKNDLYQNPNVLVSESNILFMEDGIALRWTTFPKNPELEPSGHDTIKWEALDESTIRISSDYNEETASYMISNDTLYFLAEGEDPFILVKQSRTPEMPKARNKEEEKAELEEVTRLSGEE